MDDIHSFSRRLEEEPSPRRGKRSSSERKFKPASRRRKPRSNSDDDQSGDREDGGDHSHNSVIFRYGLAFTFLLCATSIILIILAFASSSPNNIHPSYQLTNPALISPPSPTDNPQPIIKFHDDPIQPSRPYRVKMPPNPLRQPMPDLDLKPLPSTVRTRPHSLSTTPE
jgi:hypothetical protein